MSLFGRYCNIILWYISAINLIWLTRLSSSCVIITRTDCQLWTKYGWNFLHTFIAPSLSCALHCACHSGWLIAYLNNFSDLELLLAGCLELAVTMSVWRRMVRMAAWYMVSGVNVDRRRCDHCNVSPATDNWWLAPQQYLNSPEKMDTS